MTDMMNMLTFFLEPFLIAFGVTTVALLLFLSVVRQFQWKALSRRYWMRFGGMAIILGFFAAFCMEKRIVLTTPLWGLVFGTCIIIGFSVWDDLYGLSWRAQVFFQVVLVNSLCVRCTYSLYHQSFWRVWTLTDVSLLPSFLIGLAWLMLVMNSLSGWMALMDSVAVSLYCYRDFFWH
jgi:UDP-N-acetylmuramyl pentapeptide phosphotransferase/UDP-N-acetylglucosamine-1-phosphate transferase